MHACWVRPITPNLNLRPPSSTATCVPLLPAGTNILSTFPLQTVDILTGTSQAAPIVGGIAARCFAAKDCVLGNKAKGGGALNTGKILSAIEAKNLEDPAYAWTADGVTFKGRYYGPMAWANHWVRKPAVSAVQHIACSMNSLQLLAALLLVYLLLSAGRPCIIDFHSCALNLGYHLTCSKRSSKVCSVERIATSGRSITTTCRSTTLACCRSSPVSSFVSLAVRSPGPWLAFRGCKRVVAPRLMVPLSCFWMSGGAGPLRCADETQHCSPRSTFPGYRLHKARQPAWRP